MRIAWRYGESTATPQPTGESHNYFLLNKFMNLNDVSNDAKLFKFELQSANFYKDLANDLNNLIESRFNITKIKQFTNILRIGNLIYLKMSF